MTNPVESVYKDDDFVQVLWTKKFKAGYLLQREQMEVPHSTKFYEMTVAYNHNGDYIGDSKWAYNLAHKYKAVPELAKPGNRTCSIAWSEEDQTWYGYSHRAICGFKVGSMVKRGDCGYEPTDPVDFAEQLVEALHDPEWHEDTWYKLGEHGGVKCVWIHIVYSDHCPLDRMQGIKQIFIQNYPEEWGRGEWTAETIEDAKEMAIAYVEGMRSGSGSLGYQKEKTGAPIVFMS